MSRVMLPVGIDSFEKLRSNGFYYIDKTGFVEELLRDSFEVNLITRPRRFGKTLNMSMLASFLDISKDSRGIFEGLQIMDNTECCSRWMNQYPVLFLTLKSVEGLDFDSAFAMLQVIISDWCISHYDLLKSDRITHVDKELFLRFAEKRATAEEIKSSFYTLSRMLYFHYDKSVIILIDEYDVPLAKASENGYYVEMQDVIRSLIGKALKTNEYLKLSVITGCLRIAKESIFTGTNNLMISSISNERYSKHFGFTHEEVSQLLQATGFETYLDIMQMWYDGYCFGKTKIYCPWDVLNYVKDLQSSSTAKPGNYWKNTSHNSIIRSFIDRTDLSVQDKMELLLSGGCVTERIIEELTYDVLHSSEENLWSILYLTGYLTRECFETESNTSQLGSDEKELVRLKIPNAEVKSIFADTVAAWFADNVKLLDRRPLFEAFWTGNAEKVTEIVTDLLFDTISFFDYKEDYYHAFLAGLFAGAGYAVESNKEYGLGRPDLVITDRKNRRALIVEVKRSSCENELAEDAHSALEQIDTAQYDRQFLKGYKTVRCYGAAFFEKECLICLKHS